VFAAAALELDDGAVCMHNCLWQMQMKQLLQGKEGYMYQGKEERLAIEEDSQVGKSWRESGED